MRFYAGELLHPEILDGLRVIFIQSRFGQSSDYDFNTWMYLETFATYGQTQPSRPAEDVLKLIQSQRQFPLQPTTSGSSLTHGLTG